MKRVYAGILVALAAALVGTATDAAVFERFLSIERPADRAIMAYLELANAGRASSNDLAELGVLLLEKGFPEDAETYLEQAMKVDKENAEAAFRLGLVRQRLGKERAAVRAYKQAVKLRPGHGYARFMLGLAEEKRGHRRQAIFHYAKAYRHAPELGNASVNPLVYDSKLQAEAQLLRYRRDHTAATIHVRPINPAAVRRMALTKAPPPKPQPPVTLRNAPPPPTR